jgi:hypothetical protein
MRWTLQALYSRYSFRHCVLLQRQVLFQLLLNNVVSLTIVQYDILQAWVQIQGFQSGIRTFANPAANSLAPSFVLAIPTFLKLMYLPLALHAFPLSITASIHLHFIRHGKNNFGLLYIYCT